MANDDQTIIIKKIKKGGHGHHGGAWKVAYADFVTAMMAFFLLMWLLSSASDQQLQGIAEYFTPTMGLSGKMGIGVSGGIATIPGNKREDTVEASSIIFSAPTKGDVLDIQTDIEDNMKKENLNFKHYEESISRSLEKGDGDGDHVQIDVALEGLKVQISDTAARSMFKKNSAELRPFAKKILAKVARVIMNVPNFISISGHTAESLDDEDIDHWDLSTDRANNTRKFLNEVGVDQDQIGRIQGLGTRDHADNHNPHSVRNSRIAITILRRNILNYNASNYADPSFVD